MKSKLILVDGLPSSGKSTQARKIKEFLEKQNECVVLYKEEYAHPVDVFRHAILSNNDYNIFIQNCIKIVNDFDININSEEYINNVYKNSYIHENFVAIAYTQLLTGYHELDKYIKSLYSLEICNGNVCFDTYSKIQLYLWEKFSKENCNVNKTSIFEGAFFQNTMFDLVGYYLFEDDEILEYYKKILATIDCLNPKMIYVYPNDVKKMLQQALSERVWGEYKWMEGFDYWLKCSNYGKSHSLKGFEGIVEFCNELLRIEEYLINKLNLTVEIIKRY